jgi:hypothetical protein
MLADGECLSINLMVARNDIDFRFSIFTVECWILVIKSA